MIDPTQINASLPTSAPGPTERPASVEEAARQFEEVLARQFVDVMTKDLFEGGFSGEEGPSWMGGQRDMQRDTLNDVLAKHLVDSGSLRLSDLLLRQWGQQQGKDPQETNGTDPTATRPEADLGRSPARR